MSSHDDERREEDFLRLLEMIGSFVKRERKALGFKSAEKFGNELDLIKSQIHSYEAGTGRMTLETFHKIYRGLGKTTEEIFKAIITGIKAESNVKEFRLTPAQEQEVRQHLTAVLGEKQNADLTPDNITRLYLMLLYCHNKKLKKSELKEQFGLKGKGYPNNFNKALKTATDANWINMTNPDGKRDRNQQYYTSDEGIKVLRFGG